MELTFIRVDRIRSHHNRFFNSNSMEYRIQIHDPDLVEVPFTTIEEWYTNVFDEVLEFAVKHFEPWYYIGMRVSIEDLETTRPIGISFRPIHSLTTEMLVDTLSGVIQSNEEFGIASRLEIAVTVVNVPDGGAPTPLRRLTKRNLLSGKKRCIVVQNGFSLEDEANMDCLPKALVIGRALADKADKKYLKALIRRNSQKLRAESNKLTRKAGVRVDDEYGCTLNDLVKFALVLKNYEIVVYDSFTDSKSILFQSAKRDLKIALFYLPQEKHFITISRLPGFFGYAYICEDCDLLHNNVDIHRCPAVCPFCRQLGVCAPVTDLLMCLTCNRSFRGERCLYRHTKFPCAVKKKKNSKAQIDQRTVCEQLQICTSCFYFIDYRRIKEHKCTDRFCSNCKKIVDEKHLCYMQKYTKKAPKKYAIVFYDFETRSDDNVHHPNLCIASQICHRCDRDETENPNCVNCGERTRVFEGENCVSDFIDYIEDYRKFCGNHVTCIAHNAKGFDLNFIIAELLDRKRKLHIIMGGRKILFAVFNGTVRFIDSYSFVPFRLSEFVRCFGLSTEFNKFAYFPYKFNSLENINYVGPMPSERYYDIDNFSDEKREKFRVWYRQLVEQNYVFKMREELEAYCRADVTLLRLGFMRFCHSFLEMTTIHCALESMTLAQAVLFAYQKKFLQPNLIGLVPENRYRSRQNQSLIGKKWLLYQQSIQPVGTIEMEVTVPGTRIQVDGINFSRNALIFEFHGCLYHAHVQCALYNTGGYKFDSRFSELGLFERREKTRYKMQRLRDLNFTVVSIYECEWREFLKKNPDIAKQLDNHPDLTEDIDPRDCLRGGRVEPIRALVECTGENERLNYVDIVSLYPFVCSSFSHFCVDHPTIFRGKKECSEAPDIFEMEGIIKCRILPPRDLFVPVLPFYHNHKLYFPLCAACTMAHQITPCTHTDFERSIVATFTIYEVKVSLLKNYRLLEVFEIWNYGVCEYDEKTKTNNVFTEFIRCFARIKMEASGWPDHVKTEAQQDEYIAEIERKDHIRLDKQKIEHNPSYRQVSKLILNSLWGRIAMKSGEERVKTAIIRHKKELYDLLFSSIVEIVDLFFPNETTAFVQYKIKKEARGVAPTSNKNISVILGAYTTAVARQVLRSELEKINEDLVYLDTDSIIMYSNTASPYLPSLGSSFGEYTDEIRKFGPTAEMKRFACLGAKAYSYVVKLDDDKEIQVTKFKGLCMTGSVTRSRINYENMKALLTDPSVETIDTVTPTIARVKYFKLVNQNLKKTFRYTFDKRVLQPGFLSFPYGHSAIRNYN